MAPPPPPPRAPRAPPSALATGYLIFYNAAALAGWLYLLLALYAHLAQRFLRAQPLYGASLYAATALPMKVVLTSSLLEILHAVLRLVPANPATTALQVLARLLVLWGIVHLSPAAQASPALSLCFCAWALVEPTRYSFYLVKLLGLAPLYAHTWLRYSLFLVLYPAGILGEFGCLAAALLGDAAALRVEQPNALNVAYSHQLTLALLALLYPYGSYVMVGHMWRERVKQLGGGADARAKAA